MNKLIKGTLIGALIGFLLFAFSTYNLESVIMERFISGMIMLTSFGAVTGFVVALRMKKEKDND